MSRFTRRSFLSFVQGLAVISPWKVTANTTKPPATKWLCWKIDQSALELPPDAIYYLHTRCFVCVVYTLSGKAWEPWSWLIYPSLKCPKDFWEAYHSAGGIKIKAQHRTQGWCVSADGCANREEATAACFEKLRELVNREQDFLAEAALAP